MSHDTTLSESTFGNGRAPPSLPRALGLVIVWSAEPDESGKVVLVPTTKTGQHYLLGRGEGNSNDSHARLLPTEDRPGGMRPVAPLKSLKISRAQLQVKVSAGGGLELNNIGKAPMTVHNSVTQRATALPGETLELGRQIIFLCVHRPSWVQQIADFASPLFGYPDVDGIAGESPATWAIRQQINFAALQQEHVLVTGESGTGKELIAKAVHARSSRARHALVTRNASTFPETLIDAELFGNIKNYPNVGAPERLGLFGQAANSTLFLDEIAELPPALQTHLLTVMDHGEYHRLGDARARRSDVRLIGATNRPATMRADLAARFKIRIQSPGFEERREDLPFLVNVCLRSMASKSGSNAIRFFPNEDLRLHPRVSRALMHWLVTRRYEGHFRELEAILWNSVSQTSGDILEPPRGRQAAVAPHSAPCMPAQKATRSVTLSSDVVRAALERNGWFMDQAWRDLGLSSRHALARLITRHGLRRE